jgi:hypothetical protein
VLFPQPAGPVTIHMCLMLGADGVAWAVGLLFGCGLSPRLGGEGRDRSAAVLGAGILSVA